MDEEDDMVVVIVGDGSEEILDYPVQQEQTYSPDAEVECAEVEIDMQHILDTAHLHGEFISLENQNEDNNIQYLELDSAEGVFLKQKKSLNASKEEYCSDDGIARQIKPPHSYVQDLRKHFKDEASLVAHLAELMRITKPPPPPSDFCRLVLHAFGCVYCDVQSETLPFAIRHYQTKHGLRYLVCFACGIAFRSTTTLYKHEKNCSAPDAGIVLKARGKYLGRKGRSRPYRTTDRFKPGEAYTRKIKRYLCSQCSDSFATKHGLVAHENTHRGILPHKCTYCPKAYTSDSTLQRHMHQHREARFICDVCGRSFTQKTSLVSHMNTHLQQPKYGCDRCDRRYAQKTALQVHIDRDHLKIPAKYACAACPKRFPKSYLLKTHLSNAHGLTLMTRQSFFKALPTMKEKELKQATIVFKGNEGAGVPASILLNNQSDDIDFNPSIADTITVDTDTTEDADASTVNADEEPAESRFVSSKSPVNSTSKTDKIRNNVGTRKSAQSQNVNRKSVSDKSNQKRVVYEYTDNESNSKDKELAENDIADIIHQVAEGGKNRKRQKGISPEDEPINIKIHKKKILEFNAKMPDGYHRVISEIDVVEDSEENEVEPKIPFSLNPTFVVTRSGVKRTPNGVIITNQNPIGMRSSGFKKSG